MDNFNFDVFNMFNIAILNLDTTKILKTNKKAKNWGFKQDEDILHVFSFNEIDELVKSIILKKDYITETNVYFLEGKSRFVKIIWDFKNKILSLEDRTDFELLNKVKQDFITSLSHELRTPLSVAKGNIQIIKDFYSDEKFKENINKVDISLLKIEKIITQLTMLSMAQFGSYTIKKEIIDVDILINEVINDLSSKMNKKNIKINKEIKNETLNMDKFIIYTIIRNIISNAIKYSYEDSEINLLIEDNKITIQDFGIGIREDDKKRIFERFFRGSDAYKHAKGSGLGLSIVKYFCELSNIKIKFDSKWMIGTTFFLEF
ncbi:HAMP domain-containing histidine kinase [Oceanotoga sp. DSM 15011]|uniref:sensor histidine kinase n=1 Tax=Oceanotoga sp. DSM 15011 TaxID=2984951 RepID=UPI0021F4AA52|nr:HAMP domain-containing sensor histidine kinase [Oceanotoga sp. DSM 15011]UYP00486.1 HAMP domain-containing histidine kinase [Oceanotoga sp. DSM 15011]